MIVPSAYESASDSYHTSHVTSQSKAEVEGLVFVSLSGPPFNLVQYYQSVYQNEVIWDVENREKEGMLYNGET